GAPGAQSYTGVPESQAGETAGNTTQPTTAPTTPPTTNPGGGSTGTTLPKGETDLSGRSPNTNHERSLADRVLWALLIMVGLAALWAAAVPSLTAIVRHRRRTAATAPADRV